ncbi:response regulator [Paenibacillus sp. sptzw28]|uniref:response regulator n=1 Tax=Paenibacillus sp. sptzw28 TaxID=715179 RepID=UPI001C6DE50C|nr:response regulator [Paenibacillus sp. sptzw28]QYR23013.1 response regulator [Paenibacillus sp. sptzw28]
MIEILLVDDESYVTESLAKTIPWQEIGVTSVYQASSAQEALQILEEQSVDIMVTDIRMPEMDGLTLIATVAERWPHIRSMLLTGHSDFEYAKKAIQLQAFDYILKPVNDDEFVQSVTNAIESLKDEWSQSDKYNQLMYNRKSDFAVLRANLMHDLLLGRKLSHKTVDDKLKQYELPFKIGEAAVLILVQLSDSFNGLDHHSISLMEYAVGNIAEEVFAGEFHTWNCKAPHNCVAVLAALDEDYIRRIELSNDFEKRRRDSLEERVRLFRNNVSNYLKGEISVLLTEWFEFPDEIPAAYRAGLSAMLPNQADAAGGIIFLEDRHVSGDTSVKSIDLLYKPPTLIHLLESNQWDTAEHKINEVFADLEQRRYTREHLYGVLLSITNAFMYMSHKQGKYMAELDPSGYNPLFDQSLLHSPGRVREWSVAILGKLEAELSVSALNTKSFIIRQVHEIVSTDLGQETSVKMIADRVFLHPVYLSKIYKAETGESLGDYIIRMRMEKAHYLLKNSNKKIYEITSELGYQNPQYFSKMFKKYYGVTPGEFRDQ